jgi:hypothetical protein
MIALPFDLGPIRLLEDLGDLIGFQVTHGGPAVFLGRDARDLGALGHGRGFPVSYEGEEGMQCGQATVASTDRDLTFLLDVLEEGEHDAGIQIGQGQLNDRPVVAVAREAQKQTPGISV